MPQELAKKIRAKYPGEYDDLDDITLERKVLAKYPEYEDLASEEAKKPITEEPKADNRGIISKALDFATEPLTRAPSEFAKSIAAEDFSKAPVTGGYGVLAGFGRGALEGLGDVISQMTAPADLAASLLGFGAISAGRRGYKGTAEALRQGTRLASAFPVGHGIKTIADPETTAAEKLFGAVEVAGGGAGVHFPKSSIEPKLKTPVPEVAPPKVEAPVTRIPEDAAARDLERMYENTRSLDDLMNDPNYATDAPEVPIVKEVTREPVIIPEKYDELGNRIDDKYLDANQDPKVQETHDIINQLFPELATRESKRSLDLGIQEKPKGRPPITMKDVDAFLRDEDGSADYSRFFQGEEDLGYSNRTNDPDTVDLGEVTGRPIDLEAAALEAGEATAKPIRSRVRGFLADESGEFNPEFYRRPGTQEHSPDLFQFDEDVLGGQSPEFISRDAEIIPNRPTLNERIQSNIINPSYEVPEFSTRLSDTPPTFLDRLRGTMMDETGSVPRRPKEQANVWEQLPDNVKDFFQERGVGPDDIAGQTLKEVSDQYDTALKIIAEQRAKRPPSKAKQAQLVKQSGERKAPLTEDEQIEQLTREAMAAAERERNSMLKSGATELSPEDLAGFRERMQAGEPLAPPLKSSDYPQYAKPEPKASRRLSRFSRFKNFMSDESGEIRFDSPEPTERRPLPLLKAKEDIPSGVPITERTAKKYDPPSALREVYDLPVGLMSVDMPFMTSAAFRQASPLAFTKDWFKAWGHAAQTYGSQKAFDALEESIKNSKYFKPRYKPHYDAKGNITRYKEMPSIAEEAGVKLTDMKHFSAREEMNRSRLAEKLPWVKASNRSYAAFLNSLRKAKFEQLVDQSTWMYGAEDQTKLKDIADFVNNATGRASLGKLEQAADKLALGLWSPRLLTSRVKMMTNVFKPGVAPEVRKEYIKGLMRSAGTWWGLAGLAGLAGASVNTDPTNADFGKIRIGNTRIDPGSGFQQILVLMARMAPELSVDLDPKMEGETQFGKFTSSNSGETTSYGEGGPYEKTRLGVLGDFAASKMHPAARLALELLSASKNRPVHLTDELAQMVVPMMAQDIMEAMTEDPSLAAAMVPLSSMGFGTSTYGQTKEFNAPVFTDFIEDKMGLEPRSLAGTIR